MSDHNGVEASPSDGVPVSPRHPSGESRHVTGESRHVTGESPYLSGAPHAWVAMRDWLVDSLGGMPWGGVLGVGPVDCDAPDWTCPDPADNGIRHGDIRSGDVPCAQVVCLRDGTLLLRLSTTMMSIPPVAGFVAPRVMLNRWNYEDRFQDCTDGYLLSKDAGCIADLCVAWFRDRRHIAAPSELGCDYSTLSEVPRAS